MAEVKLIRLEEVAHALGISHTAVRTLVLYENKIPHVTVGARGIRVKEEDLRKYVESLGTQGGKDSGSQGSARDKDNRRPYEGRGVLPEDNRRDRPPTAIEEDS